jgi:hypothetical protein
MSLADGLGGDLLRGPGAAAGQHLERLGRDPVLGGGVAGVAQAPCRFPYVLQHVDQVDHDVDGGAAAGGLGADQVQLVLGPVDQDDPGPQVAGGRGPRPRRTRRRSRRTGFCGRTRPATWPGPSARAGAGGSRSGRRAGRSGRAGGAPAISRPEPCRGSGAAKAGSVKESAWVRASSFSDFHRRADDRSSIGMVSNSAPGAGAPAA